MKKTIMILTALFILNACEKKSTKIDSCSLVNDFLTFYATNYDQIYKTNEFVYEPNYRVNFQEVEKLSERLKLNTYFTKQFKNTFFKKYQNVDEKLKNEPQNDGTIDGFEADQFLKTQEYEEVLTIIKAKKFQCSSNNDIVSVTFRKGYKLDFQIVSGKINDIGNNLQESGREQ